MIDWNDNAKSAVKEFADWARSMVKCGNAVDVDFFLKEFTDKAQTKTVKDAVEHYNGVWPNEAHGFIYCLEDGSFISHWSSYTDTAVHQKVCTREEFEAYVKKQEFTAALSECAKESEGILKALAEQEGEKWTHVTSIGKCRVVIDKPDNHGCVVVELEGEGYSVFKPESLKPIKPTISESDEAALVKFMESSHKLEVINEVRSYIREQDIT